MPGALTARTFSTHNLMYVSRDRHTTFLEVYPPGSPNFSTTKRADPDTRGRGGRTAGRDRGERDWSRSAGGGIDARIGR